MLAMVQADVPKRETPSRKVKQSRPRRPWLAAELNRYFRWKRSYQLNMRSSGLLRIVVDERRSEVRRRIDEKPARNVCWELWAPDGQFVCSFRSRGRCEQLIPLHRARTGAIGEYKIRSATRSPDLVGPKLTARGSETRPAGQSWILAWHAPEHMRRIERALGQLEDRHRIVLEAHYALVHPRVRALSYRKRADLIGVPWSTYKDLRYAAEAILEDLLFDDANG